MVWFFVRLKLNTTQHQKTITSKHEHPLTSIFDPAKGARNATRRTARLKLARGSRKSNRTNTSNT
jgi:hypothetical protein